MRVVLTIVLIAFGCLSGGTISYAFESPPSPSWAERHSEPARGDDDAQSLAVDPWGSTYVTGSSEGAFATVKYDPDGNQLWVVRYNGGGTGVGPSYLLDDKEE